MSTIVCHGNPAAIIVGGHDANLVFGSRSPIDAMSRQDLILADSSADLGLISKLVRPERLATYNPAENVTDKPANAPTNVPPTRQRVELSAESIGFTLKSDDETIRDIEKIQETAIKAAQDVKKFALK